MTGTYVHSLDAKGRLFIPVRLREELGERFYVTVSNEACLNGYSEERWEEFRAAVRALGRPGVKQGRTAFANAACCELDSQGRVIIPRELRDKVGLKKSVTIIGNNDIAEFWDSDRWNEELEREEADEDIKALFESGLI